MNLFAQPTAAPEPKTKNTRYISIALAGVFLVLAVAQLYSFEELPAVIASMGLPSVWPSSVYAALLVTCEVLAIPFLLGMRLSPAMRIVSMVAGWLVISSWTKIAVYLNVTANTAVNSGVLGATIPVMAGWWTVCFFVALGVMAAWASWGMWPIRKKYGAGWRGRVNKSAS